jgi:hypothetical protein
MANLEILSLILFLGYSSGKLFLFAIMGMGKTNIKKIITFIICKYVW